ncbi:MAG TPA: hypothetical protein VFX96_20490 [Pyrinomonadaceae bacterium]|nr:hypothetical protein [Pyrinomonadaceae bacterium]
MSRLKDSRPGETNDAPTTKGLALRRAVACALVLLAALAACAWTLDAAAQSGRRSTKPISPVPTPTPEPVAEEGESESIPRGGQRPASTALLTLSVYESENAHHHVYTEVREMVMESFLARLSDSPSVSAARGGSRLSRKDAQREAKNSADTHVLILELAEDVDVGRESIGRADTRRLAIKLWVYEPKTGALKYTDTIWQRPYRQSTSIGGVRIPVPTTRTRRMERFPNELELEQAAREAADRTMQRFSIILPPDSP